MPALSTFHFRYLSSQTEAFICEKAIGKVLAGPWSSWL